MIHSYLDYSDNITALFDYIQPSIQVDITSKLLNKTPAERQEKILKYVQTGKLLFLQKNKA